MKLALIRKDMQVDANGLINHELLIAKLYVQALSKDALEIILSYLSNHFQREKINTTLIFGQNWFKGYLKDLYLDQFYSIFN